MAASGISRKTLEYASRPPPRKRRDVPAFRIVCRCVSTAGVLAAILFSFTVSPLTLRLAVVLLLLSFLLDGIDSAVQGWRKIRTWARGQSQPQPDNPPPKPIDWRSIFTPWTVISLLLGVTMLTCVLKNIGAFMTPDGSMSPLVESGEVVVFSKRITDAGLPRGSLIVFRLSSQTKLGPPGSFVFGRIIAGPGDAMSILADHYQVNGEPTGPVGPIDGAPVIPIPMAPAVLTLPEDRYFIVQQTAVDGAADSLLLGYAERDLIFGTRMLRLSPRGWAVPLQ